MKRYSNHKLGGKYTIKSHKLKLHFSDLNKTIIISQRNKAYTSQPDSWFGNFYKPWTDFTGLRL
jgi:hypothetical protein